MFCKFCGAKIDESSVFCPKCGKSLSDAASNEHYQSSSPTNSRNVDALYKYGRYLSMGICIFTALSPFLKIIDIPLISLLWDGDLPHEASVFDIIGFLFDIASYEKDAADTALICSAIYFIPYIVSLIATIMLSSSLVKYRYDSDSLVVQQWSYVKVSSIAILVANISVFILKYAIQSAAEIEIVQLAGIFYVIAFLAVFNIIFSTVRAETDSATARALTKKHSDLLSTDTSWVCTCGKRNPGNKNFCLKCNKSKELI